MRVASIAVLVSLALSAACVVSAQEVPKEPAASDVMPTPVPTPAPPVEAGKTIAPAAGGRFSFAPAEGGYLRLDVVSGQVSLCSLREVGWTCQLVPDDRTALDAEVARLQTEIERLKAEVAKADAGKTAPPRPRAELAPRSGKEESQLRFPTREEMERARAALERTWRHFVDMIYDFQKDVTKQD